MEVNRIEVEKKLEALFRHEYGKLVSILTRSLGPENLELAEDIVQDALLEALKNWPYHGIPANPSGWLYKVARNKAINQLSRDKYKRKYAQDAGRYLEELTIPDEYENIGSKVIADDQLRMIFISCHPSLSKDSQVALTLKTLCGFSIAEIAHAFFTTEDTINKRLVRSRQKIRDAHLSFEIPQAEELQNRMEAVLETIYLVFNEGYSASGGDELIRLGFCEDAIRMAELLVDSDAIPDKSNVYGLLALMYLNAARFNARIDKDGNILTLAEQDRDLWDDELIQKGLTSLDKAMNDPGHSLYRVLASISAIHCTAPDFDSTDWKGILSAYDRLLEFDKSPLIRLNRSIAVSKVYGAAEALRELNPLYNDESMLGYHFLHSTAAEFYIQLGAYGEAADSLRRALDCEMLEAERNLLMRKMRDCEKKISA